MLCGSASTDTAIVADLPFAVVAVIVVLPNATAVTAPSAPTAATAGSAELQVSVRSNVSAGVNAAAAASVSPSLRVTSAGSSAMPWAVNRSATSWSTAARLPESAPLTSFAGSSTRCAAAPAASGSAYAV